MYFLGVDGGGTKTGFCLIDSKGKIIMSYIGKTCHIEQVGQDGMRKVFQDFYDEALKKGIKKEQIKNSFLGIPGYSEIEAWDKKILEVVSEYFTNYTCGNDVVAGWAGSLQCESGINLVAGTGAIAYGQNDENQSARASGWGHICGDEGSAHWIGKKGIEAFGKQSDGRSEKGFLYKLICEKLKLKKDFDLIDIIHNEWKLSRTKIATLSELVSKAAKLGDNDAVKIMNEAAYEIALMVKGVRSKMEFKNKIKISYSGGVFKAKELILVPLRKHLDSYNINYELLEPKLEPVIGAALYAYKLAGNKASDEFLENLKNTNN